MSNPADRRQSARVELVGQLHGEVESLDVPIDLREISLGGMSFESPRVFEVGAKTEFRLTLGDGASVLVIGKIVYSRATGRPAPAEYVSGVQFLDEDAPDGPEAIGGLIDKVR